MSTKPQAKPPILMIAACPFPANYGTPAAIRELCNGLTDLGYDIHIVTYAYGDMTMEVKTPFVHRIPNIGSPGKVSVGPTMAKPILNLLMVIHACRVIWKYKCAVIHAHNYEGQLVGICAKYITGRPLLYNAVNSMSDELPTYSFIKPAFLAHALAAFLDWFAPKFSDYTLALTPELEEFLAKMGVPRDKMLCVPAGVWPEMFKNADPARFRKELGLEGKRVVLYAGTLDRYQRVDILLDAFAGLRAEFSDVILLLVAPFTNDAMRKKLEAQAEALGIASRIKWVEKHPLADLPDYLVLGDVAVVPRPNCPGHPIKLLNYMCTSRPIVVTAGGAKGIRHMENGYVVRDEDIKDLTVGIEALLIDRTLAVRLGERAYQTILEEYDWHMLCQKVEGIYRRMLVSKEETSVSVVGNTKENQA